MKKILIASCVLALAGMSFAASAAEGSAGFIRANIGRSDFDVDTVLGSASDKDTSAGFGGGYWFTPNVGIEGNFDLLSNTSFDDGTEVNLHTLGVGVVAKKNFGPDNTGFFVGGRAGIARMTAEVRDDDFDVVDSDHSNKVYYGVNVGYDFNSNWGMSLNWDRHQGDFDGIDIDVDTLSLAGEYRF